MRKLRWGIIGCGDIAWKRVAPALKAHPSCELAAFCSGSLARAREFCERYGVARAFDDLDAFLAEDLDCVYVASRVFQHAEQTIRALRAGRHVLCEKPMALDIAQCEDMLAAEAQAGRCLGVAYYRRFYPAWIRARELALSGALGDIVVVRILLSSFWDLPPDSPKSWRVRRELAGAGPLADVGSHRLDLLVDLLDQPESLSAFAATRHHDWDVEDSCIIAMRMKGGAFAEAAVLGNVSVARDEFDICGARGSVFLRPLGTRFDFVLDGRRIQEELPLHENVHYPLIDNFVRSLVFDEPLRCSGREAAKTTRIMDAAIRSSATGCVVRL